MKRILVAAFCGAATCLLISSAHAGEHGLPYPFPNEECVICKRIQPIRPEVYEVYHANVCSDCNYINPKELAKAIEIIEREIKATDHCVLCRMPANAPYSGNCKLHKYYPSGDKKHFVVMCNQCAHNLTRDSNYDRTDTCNPELIADVRRLIYSNQDAYVAEHGPGMYYGLGQDIAKRLDITWLPH